MTPSQLQAATGCTAAAAANFAEPLTAAMAAHGISTPNRMAGFLGNVGIESALFTSLVENLNYRADRICVVWPSRFPTPASAAQYANNPQALANKVYALRMGNGDVASGDGFKYRGRGLLQTTGRAAYEEYATHSGLDCVANPDLLCDPKIAAEVAAWDWQKLGCHALADAQNWSALTKRINGGMNGHPARLTLIQRVLKALG